jgi:hypothetical protein
MPAKKTKSHKIVERSMREVFANPPSTLKPGKSPEARHTQQVAIGLSKARAAGADVPEAPQRRKGSKARY